jgi:hypothetical protein
LSVDPDFAVAYHAGQFRLNGRREIANVLQKQGATPRRRDPAVRRDRFEMDLILARGGAEEQQIEARGLARAVDADEGRACSATSSTALSMAEACRSSSLTRAMARDWPASSTARSIVRTISAGRRLAKGNVSCMVLNRRKRASRESSAPSLTRKATRGLDNVARLSETRKRENLL